MQARQHASNTRRLDSIRRQFTHAQDLEILKGYVPGFDGVLGHECVARVIECPSQPDLVGEPSHDYI